MRVIRKILLVLTVILCLTECVNLKDVTQEGFESYGADLFQNFVYFISKDIILRETVDTKTNPPIQNDSGNVILLNREISLSRKTRGRVQNVSSNKIEVTFEELPGEIRPTITFKQNSRDKQKRYFIDFTLEDVNLVDQTGPFGYITLKKRPVISYNGTKYLLIYNKPDEPPYLTQDLDIKIINEYRRMRGLR